MKLPRCCNSVNKLSHSFPKKKTKKKQTRKAFCSWYPRTQSVGATGACSIVATYGLTLHGKKQNNCGVLAKFCGLIASGAAKCEFTGPGLVAPYKWWRVVSAQERSRTIVSFVHHQSHIQSLVIWQRSLITEPVRLVSSGCFSRTKTNHVLLLDDAYITTRCPLMFLLDIWTKLDWGGS